MFQEQFVQFGLTKTQAAVMDYLLENGEKKAREVAKGLGQPRGVAYKALEELVSMKLIERIDEEKQIARFRAQHPRQIERIFETKQQTLNQNKRIFEEMLPGLSSVYNLALNKPGVKFYEGVEGTKKILEDTLTSKTEIYLFLNSSAAVYEESFRDLDKDYTQKRKKSAIIKKIIDVYTPDIKMEYDKADEDYKKITEVKFIKKELYPFKSAIQIYDNKISYQIFEKGKVIAVLIEDKNIYQMHKAWFELTWNSLK